MPEQSERRDGRVNSGGPRPKVRPDDQRGAEPGGLQAPYIPNDADRQIVLDYAVVVGRKLLARRIGVSQSTLERHYGKELNEAVFKAAAINGGRIWKRASEGDHGAQYFFQRLRGGWNDKDDLDAIRPDEDQPNGFAVPPEILAELSDEEFALYERLCERLLANGTSSARADARPAISDHREGDEAAGADGK